MTGRLSRISTLLAQGAAVLWHCLIVTAASADDLEQFFESEVRPLLVQKCLDCHGTDEQSGGLRLDSRDAVLKGGEHGLVVDVEQSASSRLIHAVRRDGDLKMPPDEPLTEHEQAVLVRWVELGAPWPSAGTPLQSERDAAAARHWAFQPVSDPEVPRNDDVSQSPSAAADSHSANGVDSFILQRLNTAGLSMSPLADRRTLIRRISYVLTGLPPSMEVVERVVADPDPRAIEHLVDELLASPAFGEHQARHWLDIARYSDTKGYVYAREERFWIHAWSYRDWVVDALNADMPYDRFLLLQLAADQVPDRSESDLAAMGFLTLGRRFLGVRRDIIDDRIDVVCRGTMALTVVCARCHDHKYDPIPTADYYSLYGVFDSCHEAMVPIGSVSDERFTNDLAKKKESLESALRERCATSSERVRARIADYLMAQTQLGQYPEEGFDQILESDDLLPAFVHRWRDGLRTARRTADPVFAAWLAYSDVPAAEFSSRTASVTEQLQQLAPEQLHPKVRDAFRDSPATLREVADRYASILQAIDESWKQAMAATSAGAGVPTRLPDENDERLRRILYGPGSLCEVPSEPLVQVEYDMDSAANNELWKLQSEFDRTILNAGSEPRWSVTLVDRAVSAEPRVFRRGNPADKGDNVPRQFLKLLSGDTQSPFANGSGRLELAQAITDPSNPLTARVMVNRVWRDVFGAGLVTTPGDFGLRAERPSHPELLDWLTSRFIEEGLSVKQLCRRLVLSAAFQQSSAGPLNESSRSAAIAIDPANRLLWRMNVHRLSFEELRDSMLTASSRLDRRIGGRPQELFKTPYPTRRTLYGLVDRQFLPGTLRMFDFANPDLHIPQRSETTVPQQSLFLMNHPLVLDECRATAEAIESESTEDAAGRLFRRTLQRDPTEDERLAANELLHHATPPELTPAPVTAADWTYGSGQLDEASARVVSFQPLPHFNGTAWQGGPAWPDGALGWVQLTAGGGHPGNDREHAAVRRWTAPRAMTISIDSHLQHEPDVSDGVRAFIVSSRAGVLATATVKHSESDLDAGSVSVEAGEMIDFVVDIGTELNSDMFLWPAAIVETPATERATSTTWNSATDFPPGEPPQLSPLEQLAQVLFCSNEFAFVD